MIARPTLRQVLSLGVVICLAGCLAACGRKGYPKEAEDAVYPRSYPYTPLPAGAVAAPDGAGDTGATAAPPFQPPQPRPARPDELVPPTGDTGTSK